MSTLAGIVIAASAALAIAGFVAVGTKRKAVGQAYQEFLDTRR